MDSKKYFGMDVHLASISAAVRDKAGKLVMECILETKAVAVLEFIQRLRGSLCVTFEDGTSAAWLYDLIRPRVAQVVVCDPRKNALLKADNKNDRVDARKLSELLRAGPGQRAPRVRPIVGCSGGTLGRFLPKSATTGVHLLHTYR